MDQLLTDQEVANFLGISKRTLFNMLHREPKAGALDIRFVERAVVGGHRRWVKADLMKTVEENTKENKQ